MGQFKIFIHAVGGHGCDQEAGEGEDRTFCGDSHCADDIAREAVRALKAAGYSLEEATLSHWPDSSAAVVDDLRDEKRRSGSFQPKP